MPWQKSAWSKSPRPKSRQSGVLPKCLPVGTVFVVEGRPGVDGDLRVSSRYLIVPGGGRIDLLGRSARARHGSRQLSTAKRLSAVNRQRRSGTGAKDSAGAAKKFVVVAGTGA
jgi:hypothetical protein